MQLVNSIIVSSHHTSMKTEMKPSGHLPWSPYTKRWLQNNSNQSVFKNLFLLLKDRKTSLL